LFSLLAGSAVTRAYDPYTRPKRLKNLESARVSRIARS
jgi:hypothetical protein